jgi:serine protease Do
MRGELIGIASFIKTKAGGSDGLGFAVTINTAKARMLEQNPFYLGLDIRYAKGLLAEALNIPQAGGMLVQTVAKGSLADKMGVQGGSVQIQFGEEPIMLGGDVILEIDGVSAASPEDLSRIQSRLGEVGIREGFELKILRHGQIRKLTWRGN